MQVYIYTFLILIARAAAVLQNGIRQKWGQMKRMVHVSRQVRVERVVDQKILCLFVSEPTYISCRSKIPCLYIST